MEFNELTPEQMEKAKACKTVEDIVKLAKEEGAELSDEQLEKVAGGDWTDLCTKLCGIHSKN